MCAAIYVADVTHALASKQPSCSLHVGPPQVQTGSYVPKPSKQPPYDSMLPSIIYGGYLESV